jgi:hypothetical protein
MKKDKISLGRFNMYIEEIIHHRFSDKKELQEEISKLLGFEINLQEKENINTDYCLISNLDLGDKDLYLDLYYLIDLQGNLYITEYGFDGESRLKDNDFNSIILGDAK